MFGPVFDVFSKKGVRLDVFARDGMVGARAHDGFHWTEL